MTAHSKGTCPAGLVADPRMLYTPGLSYFNALCSIALSPCSFSFSLFASTILGFLPLLLLLVVPTPSGKITMQPSVPCYLPLPAGCHLQASWSWSCDWTSGNLSGALGNSGSVPVAIRRESIFTSALTFVCVSAVLPVLPVLPALPALPALLLLPVLSVLPALAVPTVPTVPAVAVGGRNLTQIPPATLSANSIAGFRE
jgi:hypothetical protein